MLIEDKYNQNITKGWCHQMSRSSISKGAKALADLTPSRAAGNVWQAL